MKNIQVFLIGDDTCEINGELVKFEIHDTLAYVLIKEDRSCFSYHLPISQIRMIRIWEGR